MKIAVIGAGASGMAAALQAAWYGGDVTLIERNETAGRKLLVTGSGRCNITNEAVSAGVYACADNQWMETLLGRFGVRQLIEMLSGMAIPIHKTDDGWYYPLSESAHSVVDAFSCALAMAGVKLLTSSRVNQIRIVEQGFIVRYATGEREWERKFDRVVVAAGGKAYPSLGSRGELYPLLQKLGHTILPVRPALAPLLVDLGDLKSLQGLRLDVKASVWDGHTCLGSSTGNMIFTEWGVNGPAVMNVSHIVSARPETRLTLSLDLLAFVSREFNDLLANKRDSNLPLKVFFEAFFAPKVADVLMKYTRFSENMTLNQLDDKTCKQLESFLKDIRLPIKGVRDFDYCQVSAGGVPVTQVDPSTMESMKVKGLYLTGETLDVVGPCGGYNLQFAFSSGALAGMAAARSV